MCQVNYAIYVYFQSKKVQAITAFSFDQEAKKGKESLDPKEVEAKQKRSQVLFYGQHAVSKLREAFDMLSNSLGLQVHYNLFIAQFAITWY